MRKSATVTVPASVLPIMMCFNAGIRFMKSGGLTVLKFMMMYFTAGRCCRTFYPRRESRWSLPGRFININCCCEEDQRSICMQA